MIDKYKKRPTFIPLSMFLSLVGIIFCTLIANGYDLSACVSVGCTLFQDMSLYGISLWWVGTLAFSLFFILAFLGRATLAKFFTAIALFIDIILLCVMFNIASCTNCLIVAFLLACTYLSFRFVYIRNGPNAFKSLLFVVWCLLFIANVVLTLKSGGDGWILYGNENANVKMYFAPSCESCKEGFMALADNPDVAFYPVSNEDKDIYYIAKMHEQIKLGKNIKEALTEALESKVEDYKMDYFSPKNILLYFRLMKNKALVIEASGGTIPYFEISGLPKFLSKGNDASTSESRGGTNNINGNTDYALPLDLEISGSCGEEDTIPCP